MINIHIGLDLSFNSTGITFYSELFSNGEITNKSLEFHRLIRDKEMTTTILNVNQHIYSSYLLSVDNDFKHKQGEFENSISYSNDQIDLTVKYFISVTAIKNLILNYFKNIKEQYSISNDNINVYINMEGSILSGHNFNTQIGVNMLQGFLRAELIKIQLVNKFNSYKFRIVPPTLLKSFFTNNGKADKTDMVESFIENYNGKKLIPQINLTNKMIGELNDIIDSFALVAFNVYDMVMEDQKYLFNIKKIKSDKPRKKRIKLIRKTNSVPEKNLPDNINNFESNIKSNILLSHGII